MSEKYVKHEIRLGDALKEAWGIFLKGPEVFVGVTFLYFAVVFTLNHLPVVGQLINIVVFSLLIPAFLLLAASGEGKERITFEALKGLTPHVPQLLALSVVKSILLGIGFMLLFFPGIYVMVACLFAECFVVLAGKPFLDALKASQRLAHENFLGVLGLMIVVVMLAMSGLLLVGIGVLVTLPLALLLLYCVFRRVRAQAPVVVA